MVRSGRLPAARGRGRLPGSAGPRSTRHPPRLGEIYVIAADPDFAGRGLGRRLVLAGLAHLAGQGITVATLYTEADNKAAIKLYVNLDFIVDHLDRSFTLMTGRAPLDRFFFFFFFFFFRRRLAPLDRRRRS